MDGTTPPGTPGSRRRRLLYAGGLLAAGTLAGGIIAGTTMASAAGNGSTAAPSTSPSGAPEGGGPGGSGSPPAGAGTGGGSAPVRSDEKALSTADAAKVPAAALAAVPGGTVYRVETDAGDGVYEAHMKKADGTLVTVKLDASFAVLRVEAGMGAGDPAPTPRATTSTP